jgi:hypothetical protein
MATVKHDELMELTEATAPAIAQEIHDVELARRLKGLGTHDGKNYAFLEKPTRTPQTDISILPSPAVPPAGATEICKGDLTLNGAKVAVSAFRLA